MAQPLTTDEYAERPVAEKPVADKPVAPAPDRAAVIAASVAAKERSEAARAAAEAETARRTFAQQTKLDTQAADSIANLGATGVPIAEEQTLSDNGSLTSKQPQIYFDPEVPGSFRVSKTIKTPPAKTADTSSEERTLPGGVALPEGEPPPMYFDPEYPGMFTVSVPKTLEERKKEAVAQIPVYGSYAQGRDLIDNWNELDTTFKVVNAGGLAFSAITDAMLVFGVGQSVKSTVTGSRPSITAVSTKPEDLSGLYNTAKTTNTAVKSVEVVATPDEKFLLEIKKFADQLPYEQRIDIATEPTTASIRSAVVIADELAETRPGAPKPRVVVEIDSTLMSDRVRRVANEVASATQGQYEVTVRGIKRGDVAKTGIEDVIEARVNVLKKYDKRPYDVVKAEVTAEVQGKVKELRAEFPDATAAQLVDELKSKGEFKTRAGAKGVRLEQITFDAEGAQVTKKTTIDRTIRLEPEPRGGGGGAPTDSGGGIAIKLPETGTQTRITSGVAGRPATTAVPVVAIGRPLPGPGDPADAPVEPTPVAPNSVPGMPDRGPNIPAPEVEDPTGWPGMPDRGPNIPAPEVEDPTGWPGMPDQGPNIPAPEVEDPTGWPGMPDQGPNIPAPEVEDPTGWPGMPDQGPNIPAPEVEDPTGWPGTPDQGPNIPAPEVEDPTGWPGTPDQGPNIPAPEVEDPTGWQGMPGKSVDKAPDEDPTGWQGMPKEDKKIDDIEDTIDDTIVVKPRPDVESPKLTPREAPKARAVQLPADTNPKLVQWKQGKDYVQVDLQTGRSSITAQPILGGVKPGTTPAETFKVLKTTTAPIKVRKIDLGETIAVVTPRRVRFEPDPTGPAVRGFKFADDAGRSTGKNTGRLFL
jgi:hypothetical protein